ncbi:hypothetical protein [Terrabacter sp. 2RAF25]|uniref:hypothetical protein n=1 Tax=Terrabacter sp. 2RAF25 TaxID=3232998 RepID=UPI003F9562C8
MLHEVTGEGGLGFCQVAFPWLLPPGYHGPLVIALDSNVLIDLQQHGTLLLNDEVPEVDKVYAADLVGESELLNLWLLRDIRFVVTPRSLTDAKKASAAFVNRRRPAVDAIARSLAFQLGDWSVVPPSEWGVLPHVGTEVGLPDGADRDLVLEAQAIGAHVFLTRDRALQERVSLRGPALAVLSPGALADELIEAGVQPFFGGTCDAHDCPYDAWGMPAPDMGKWGGLLSIFDNE